MSSIYRTVTSAALAGVVAGAYFVSSPAQSTELLINNYLPPKHPFQTGITVPWMKDVVAATKGSVTPKLSAAAVGPPPKNWQTVSKGVADVVILANIFQTKRIVGPQISQLPLNSPGAVKTSLALWNTHEKYFAKANEYKGNHLIGSFLLAPNVIHSRGKPIVTVADLKGFKLRSAPGITTNILKELGAVPVASGPAKIFSLVSKGVVDGAAVPGHGLRAFRILPYIKATTVIPGGLTNTSFSMLINGKKWDGLTKPQQDQIMSVSGLKLSERTLAGQKAADSGIEAVKKQGGQVIQAGPELMGAIRKLGQKAEADWLKAAGAKGIDAKASMAFFKEQLK